MKNEFSVQERFQLLTSFPNQNNKKIDYVIVYEKIVNLTEVDFKNQKKNAARKAFFNKLKSEGFDIYEIEQIYNDKTFVYSLLNCSVERLLEEAELTRLEMKLKNSEYKTSRNEIEINWLNKIKEKFSNQGKKKDTNDYVSSWYIHENKSLFELISDPNHPEGPFNNCLRSLLVDSILNNLQITFEYNNQLKSIKGLPYFIFKKYFDESFILHDQTNHQDFLKILKEFEEEHLDFSIASLNYLESIFQNFNFNKQPDPRAFLQDNWASLKKIFKFQPLGEIKDYFGEKNGIYFAWVGSFIASLWIPSIVGVFFFVLGISLYYTDELLFFGNAFDNPMMPFYAMFIFLWGAFFIESWKRKNARLAFNWNCDFYEEVEPDLPEYTKIKHLRKKNNNPTKLQIFFYKHEVRLKAIVSFIVFLGMATIVVLCICLTILFRVWIKVKVLPKNKYAQIIIKEVGAEIIMTFFIMILSYIYKKIAQKLTHWENHRTKSQYENSLIIKLFSFEFVNSYGYLFYLSHLRKHLNIVNGVMGLGSDFIDKCELDNCTGTITVEMIIILIMFPIPRFFLSFIWPYLSLKLKRKFKMSKIYVTGYKKSNRNSQIILEMNDKIFRKKTILNTEDFKSINEKAVLIYLNIHKEKKDFEDTILEEYVEKAIMFGFLLLFGSAFTLAPLLILIVTMLDLKLDAYRILWLFKRPIGHKAQHIGVWLKILQFLNLFGIINQSFWIAFTSEWSKYNYLNDSNFNRFVFVSLFEHLAIFLWILIVILIPDIPSDIAEKTRISSRLRRYLLSKK